MRQALDPKLKVIANAETYLEKSAWQGRGKKKVRGDQVRQRVQSRVQSFLQSLRNWFDRGEEENRANYIEDRGSLFKSYRKCKIDGEMYQVGEGSVEAKKSITYEENAYIDRRRLWTEASILKVRLMMQRFS